MRISHINEKKCVIKKNYGIRKTKKRKIQGNKKNVKFFINLQRNSNLYSKPPFFSTPSTFPTNCTNSGGVNIPRQPTRRRRNRRSHRGASVHLLHPPAATGRVLELVDASVRQYDCERKLAAYFRSLRRPAPAQGELADCLWCATGQNRRRDWAQSGVRWRTAGKRFGTGKMSYGGRAAMSIDFDSVMRVFLWIFFSVCLWFQKILLKKPLVFTGNVQPIPIFDQRILPTSVATIVGYGVSSYGKDGWQPNGLEVGMAQQQKKTLQQLDKAWIVFWGFERCCFLHS